MLVESICQLNPCQRSVGHSVKRIVIMDYNVTHRFSVRTNTKYSTHLFQINVNKIIINCSDIYIWFNWVTEDPTHFPGHLIKQKQFYLLFKPYMPWPIYCFHYDFFFYFSVTSIWGKWLQVGCSILMEINSNIVRTEGAVSVLYMT